MNSRLTDLVASILTVIYVSTIPASNAVLMAAPELNPEVIDCSDAYGRPAANCELIQCPQKFQDFLGRWEGPFETYARELQGFRPYANVITYAKEDCLKNIDNGDQFIIGRRTDTYPEFAGQPAKIEVGLLITGFTSDGTPFLRTFSAEGGLDSYQLAFKNNAASLSAWQLNVTTDTGLMSFSTIDGRDWSAPDVHKRNVTVTLSVGDPGAPVWEGVIVRGYHTHVGN